MHLLPHTSHRFPQRFCWLRAEETRYYLAFAVNNGKEGMSPPTVLLLQPGNGRFVSFQARHGHLPYKFIRKSIHDGLHLQSGRSPIGVEHDQSRGLYFDGKLFCFISSTANQRRR
jgi:hypothetical protein